MKTIGLLGGTAWISTIEYYRILNEKVHNKLGKQHSAKVAINSIDYQDIKQFNYQNWDSIETILKKELIKLANWQTDCILICNNTLHKAYDAIASSLNIPVPVFHIADCAGQYAVHNKMHQVLLLGTKFTMEEDFYKKRLHNFGLQIIIPNEIERTEIQRISQEELSKGIYSNKSKQWFQKVIAQYSCDGVILGCTELPLLLKQDDYDVPLINTLEIHCETAVNFCLQYQEE